METIMNRVIMIKYGELTTKKSNRKLFINALYNNILNKLDGMNVKIIKDISRMYIEFNEEDLDNILKKINHVFGIHSYLVAYKINSDIEDINNTILNILPTIDFKTFKVETKRSDKNFPFFSTEFSKKIGGLILKNKSDINVDVHNPEVIFHIEIRQDYTYIYMNEYMGVGGYPVGTQPRGMLMLSGGIDSPVAGYLAMKRGVKLDCVYFEAIPHTSIEARNKVVDLCRKLAEYTDNINLHVVNFTPIQEEIYKNCREDYCITIMRRMMYRIMEKLSKKYKGYAIVNGESIGQVASQTLTSMNVINSVTNMPVIRPVACLDKLEIMEIARKLGTYEISILPFEDCCTIFVPKHPVINPNLDLCIEYEKTFDYSSMIDDAIKNRIIIEIKEEQEENKFKDLL